MKRFAAEPAGFNPARRLRPAGPPFAERPVEAPHRLERAVQRRLLSQPELHFSSLVVRRIPNGVCLEGVLESDVDLDVCDLASSVAGVERVINHLVIRRPSQAF